MFVSLVHRGQNREMHRVVMPSETPAAQCADCHQVWRTLVEDTHVAGHLTVPAKSRPFQGLHRRADGDRWQATQPETLNVSEWNAPATVGDDCMTD